MEYSLGLALEDFLPVLFSALGLFILAGMIRRIDRGSGTMAYLGFALVALGGLLKASWKLVYVTSGQDVVWMADSLFVLLGPGFTFFAWALWSAQQALAGKTIPRNVWLRPLGVIALFGVGAISASVFAGGRTWNYILLTLTTFANLAVGVLLIRQSRQQGLTLAAALFLVNLVVVFAMSGMARIENQTIALQWFEQIVNTLGQGAFAFAAWQLSRDTLGRMERTGAANENG